MTHDTDDTTKTGSGTDAAAEVSVLDHTLWSRFSEDRDLAEFAKIWLALQVRQAENISRAVVVLETHAGAGLVPVAFWPPETPPTAVISNAVEQAVNLGSGASVDDIAIAVPLVIDDEVIGAVGLERDVADRPATAALLRQLKWGAGWLVSAIRRGLMQTEARDRASMAAVLDVVGATLDAGDMASASLAAANILARKMDCAQVVIGMRPKNRMRAKTLSDVSDFRLNTTKTRNLEAALNEAFEQEGTILYPPREGQGFVVSRAHKDLAQLSPVGEILTVPLFAEDRVIGAISYQKPAGQEFALGEIMLAEGAAATLGPIFADKIENEQSILSHLNRSLRTQIGRLIGHGYIGRKIAAACLIGLMVFFAVAKADYRVHADAEVQGLIVRALTASYEGHVLDARARAGDIVKSGEELASLDDRDLLIELLRWQTDLGRYRGEYDKALADRDATAVRIAGANIDQSQAKMDLVRLQLARAKIIAPFDGVVIEGDLSQSIGAAVRRGEELFKIAPLDGYRVALEVDETNLDEMSIGQQGTLVLSSLPSETYTIEVAQITPSLQARDGRNFAIVEAQLLGSADGIRPGMRGVAKVQISERLLIENWTQPIIDWFRLAIWRWTP